ncbi:hypothetical protein GCM10020220_023140 [Nonomuraea rubra]
MGLQGIAADPPLDVQPFVYLYYSPKLEHPGRRRPRDRHEADVAPMEGGT